MGYLGLYNKPEAEVHTGEIMLMGPKEEKEDIGCAPLTLFSVLSPSRLFLFSKLKSILKGRRFQTIQEIQKMR
jgi:hypothetical protein